MGQWIERCERADRKPFEPMWLEAIELIKAKTFHSQGALAIAYKSRANGRQLFRKVAVKQGVMKEAEW
jgi:hypothetical protein